MMTGMFVRHGDASHARFMRGKDPLFGIFQHQTFRWARPDRARGGEKNVRRRLDARHIETAYDSFEIMGYVQSPQDRVHGIPVR